MFIDYSLRYPSFKTYPSDGIQVVLGVFLLQLPDAFAGCFRIEGFGILTNGKGATLNGHGFPLVIEPGIMDFEDAAGQAAELPRAAFDGYVSGKPSYKIATSEMASGHLAFVAKDRLC